MNDAPQERTGLSANWAVREVDHLFSRLGRYTLFVVYSKWSLGVFAIVLMGSLIAWPLISKDDSGVRISFIDSSAVKPGAKADSPVMENPEYRGTGAKGEQYRINGIKATQVTPQLALIDEVNAQLLRADGRWMQITSVRAEFHQETKILELFGDVMLIDDRGYSFNTEHATLDTNTMDAHGNEAISGTGPMGNLLASGFEMRDKGNHIIFTGGAQQLRMHIDRAKTKNE